MRLYEMEGLLRGHCLPGDLRVGESTAEYLTRKLKEGAEAKAQVASLSQQVINLAVENEALKKCCDAYDADGLAQYGDQWEVTPLETPATDAAIAAIQAQGVDRLADHLSGLNIIASETSVREFAAQLRKESTHD